MNAAPKKTDHSTTEPRTIGDTPQGGSVLGFYAPKGSPRPPRIARGEGIYLWDTEGRRYLDATAGAVVVNLGHGNRNVLAAMAEQAQRATFAYPRFFESEHSVALADSVCALACKGFDRAFFVSGGSEANESALKLCRQYAVVRGETQRWKVISREPSYHGATLGALAVTGDAHTRSIYGAMVRDMPRIAAPQSYRIPDGHTAHSHAMACADELEATILREGPAEVLAFILEPVGGLATGATFAPDAYYRRVREICTRHGVLLIFDEIMSGAGRTGRFLAAEHFGADAQPDIVTLAKGLAAGYTPLGAMLVPDRMVDTIAGAGGFVHGHTYFSNPLSCAVAKAVLDEVVRMDLVNQSRLRGEQLMARLQALAASSPIVGDVRGKGLLTAIELVADKSTKRQLPVSLNAPARLTEHGLKHGIALYNRRANLGAYGDMQLITPPLTITEGELDELAELLGRALADLADELLRQHLI